MEPVQEEEAGRCNIRLCRAARPRCCAAEVAGLDLLVLDAPHLFDRPGSPYGDTTGADWPDNWRRFAALSQVGAEIAGGAVSGWQPDIVHAHDWQAALTLAYMRFGQAGRHAVGHDRPQPRLPGPVRRSDLRRARPAGRGHGARRRRILRRRRLSQGRAAGRLGDHHRQPDLCAGDPHAGIRHGPRRPAQHARRRPRTASSTASTPRSGIPRPTRCSPRNYDGDVAEGAGPTTRAVEERFGLEQRRRPAALRRQPPHLAEGHGHPGRGARRLVGIGRQAGGARLRRPGARRRAARRRGAPSRPRRRRHRL